VRSSCRSRLSPPGFIGACRTIVRLLTLSGLILALPHLASSNSEDCSLSRDPRLVEFRLEQLDRETRCLLALVINNQTTSGAIGPVQAGIAQDLYDYLLDRPIVTAALVDRLGLAAYRVNEAGPGQFWIDDGDGTQGLLRLVHQQGGSRIYHIEGHHDGHVFSKMRAMAVVFLTLKAESETSTTASVVAFVRLNDRWLAGIVRVLKPLLEGGITRKVTRGFEVTYQLGQRIAQDPDRILQEIGSLPFEDQDEAERFKALVAATAIPTVAPGTPSPLRVPHP
jgi:hypothetical protein